MCVRALSAAVVFLYVLISQINCLEVIYALNAGGDAFTDSLGIRYRRDFLSEGVASDYGKMLDIKRAALQDKILYQTERYHSETFGYTYVWCFSRKKPYTCFYNSVYIYQLKDTNAAW
jgi:hypothetical protein